MYTSYKKFQNFTLDQTILIIFFAHKVLKKTHNNCHFAIDGSPPVYLPPFILCHERRPGPLVVVHGHHVGVAHQKVGGGMGVGTVDGYEDALTFDNFKVDV